MGKWASLVLLFAHALVSAQERGDTGTVHLLGSRKRLRLHGMPRRRPPGTPAASRDPGSEAASSSDDMQQQPSSEMEDDNSTGGEQGLQLQDGALGDQSAGGDTEAPLDEWVHGQSSDFHDD